VRWRVLLGLVLVLGPAAGCGPDRPAKTFIVAGTVRLTAGSGVHSGQPCAAAEGAEVVVSGPGGRLGVGRLVEGSPGADGDCVWTFFVPDVDADARWYDVAVAGHGPPRRYDPSTVHGRVDLTITA
jgi:hypothetical protein